MVSPVGAFEELKQGAGARGVGFGVSKHVIFVVAANEMPAVFFDPLLDDFEAGDGGGAAVDGVTGDDYVVGVPVVEVLQDGLEGGQVAVDVGDDSYFHRGSVQEARGKRQGGGNNELVNGGK